MITLSGRMLGLYEKALPNTLSWEEKFTLARDAGYDFIELSIDATRERIVRLDWTQAQIDEVRRCMDRFSMPMYTMALTANRYFTLGDERASQREKGREIVYKGVDLAVKMGIRAVQLATYDVFEGRSTEQTDAYFLQSLRSVCDYAAQRAVTLCLEVMDVPYSDTPEKVMRFVREINTPFLQIYADFGNQAATGGDNTLELPKGAGHIIALHVKDGYPGRCREVPFGEGTVDFVQCFYALRQMDYHGLLIAEMWSNDNLDFIPYLAEANRFIRQKMAEADKLK